MVFFFYQLPLPRAANAGASFAVGEIPNNLYKEIAKQRNQNKDKTKKSKQTNPKQSMFWYLDKDNNDWKYQEGSNIAEHVHQVVDPKVVKFLLQNQIVKLNNIRKVEQYL